MTTWTRAAIIAKVELDLDLQEEAIVTASEMGGYLNDAIVDFQALAETLDEDYFLTKTTLALVQGQSLITLPANCYASKIRGIEYRNGPLAFEIKRLRKFHEFARASDIDYIPAASPIYKYILLNNSNTAGVQIELHPPAQETSASNVTLWYLREATQLVNPTDVCDVPEGINYIFAHMKKSCLAKENLGTAPPDAIAALEKQEQLVTNALQNRVPDDDNEIQLDMSHYQDHT
jgi:hypothetical protein